MNEQLKNTIETNTYIIKANQLRNKAIATAFKELIEEAKQVLSTLPPTWVAGPQAA